jgi:hypothetical protein
MYFPWYFSEFCMTCPMHAVSEKSGQTLSLKTVFFLFFLKTKTTRRKRPVFIFYMAAAPASAAPTTSTTTTTSTTGPLPGEIEVDTPFGIQYFTPATFAKLKELGEISEIIAMLERINSIHSPLVTLRAPGKPPSSF